MDSGMMNMSRFKLWALKQKSNAIWSIFGTKFELWAMKQKIHVMIVIHMWSMGMTKCQKNSKHGNQIIEGQVFNKITKQATVMEI